MPSTEQSPVAANAGAISNFSRRMAGVSARRPWLTIGLWLVLVISLIVAGHAAGTRNLTFVQEQPGAAGVAAGRMSAAGLGAPDVESILVRSAGAHSTAAVVELLAQRLRALPDVTSVQTAAEDGANQALSRDGGAVQLVAVTLVGDVNTESQTVEVDRVKAVERVVAQTASAHPHVSIDEVGQGSLDQALNLTISHDLRHAELIAVPVTLVILVLAFGALVAAVVPLVLAFSSVAATLGALGLLSRVVPNSSQTSELVVLIGLAVGIDYSLFYIRRERAERRTGRDPSAALDVAAATVGRAVLIAGLTVIVALSGLFLSGSGDFRSMALGAMLVVAISLIGSLTALPALLALLGDRIDRGRLLPVRRHATTARDLGARTAAARPSANRPGLAGVVTTHPVATLLTTACVLMALAVPALSLHTSNPTEQSDMPAGSAIARSQTEIERYFPGTPSPALLVITGQRLNGVDQRSDLLAIADQARALVKGDGARALSIARDGRTAVISIPMNANGPRATSAAVKALRSQAPMLATRLGPDAQILVTGTTAASVDFAAQLNHATPRVVAFVPVIAFALLLLSFGSAWLAVAVIVLNLLSVGAAYGIVTAVFQGQWAQRVLDFSSNGTIVSWVPLFMFVILFGLSMDYTILILERIREARSQGLSARAAATDGLRATAGTVTSAAVIMVAVFGIFASLRIAQMKQLGFGLAVAIALDATLVRAVALPAVVALLGERRWRVERQPTAGHASEQRAQSR